ncbi:LacI family transcriptional regulator [Gillisia sp. M10.2A]|uniref:LacI family transcriptional regulator n=1 Tax=Gillisia lutea TaxID=2909668 RepID=A0ABS9EI98_9FLAO|nr:LacI family DNA-binding transcriptional regulator [Gillisia lutea]MCF4102551.1 LacI family transcriptional regulator [Gillisia lutea]
MGGKSTLKDLAKILNLSVSTVSKAINNSPEISDVTKDKVRSIALLNNYSPNKLAQSLKSQRTKTIGVIIPDVLMTFFAMAIHGIEQTANSYGYKVIICLSNESLEKEAESINTLVNGSVDGLIMSLSKETQSTNDYAHFEEAIRYNTPIVLFDRTSDLLICDKIKIDDTLAAKEATEHLLKIGCRNIIFLTTIYGTSVGEKRRLGYLQAIENTGVEDTIINIKDYAQFECILIEALKQGKIDGIVAADELSAISTIKYSIKHSYKIPEDISVIGFTNGVLGENFVPSLTVVDQHATMQGSLAAETLIKRLEKKIPVEPVHKVLKTSIIERESTLPLFYAK